MTDDALFLKYDYPVARYTSYPTVPQWSRHLSASEWLSLLSAQTALPDGLALYLHIPYCDSKCFFCGCNTTVTRQTGFENPYTEALLSEWRLIKSALPKRALITDVHLGGGTPTLFSANGLASLFETLFADMDIADGFEFSFESNPKNTTREHLIRLYQLGFRRISFGIQDFDPTVQHIINRVQPVSMVEQVITEARNIGFTSINLDLVYGLPRQNEHTIRHTISEVRRLQPDRIAFYAYGHNPHLYPEQRRFEHEHLPEGEEKARLYQIGKTLLSDSSEHPTYVEIGMDHFALKTDSLWQAAQNGTLHRNFMGYTARPSAGVIALGASAISDSWTALVQNEKDPILYMTRVRNGELPLYRSHKLTEEDLILRQHILSLMCRFQTEWSPEEADLLPLNRILEQMKSFEDDGLVACSDHTLYVTLRGRPFIRYICAAFDHYQTPQSPARSLS